MFSITVVDYIGKMEDGIGVILSMIISNKQYEILYWFNKNNNYRLVIDKEFYQDNSHITNIYEYDGFNDLVQYIDYKVLPPRKDIWKEFEI